MGPFLSADRNYGSRLMHITQNPERWSETTSTPHSSHVSIISSPVRSHPSLRHSALRQIVQS